jgi:hypothetical protein
VAIWGTGSLAGGLAYGSRNWKSAGEGRAMICLALFGAMLVLLAAAPGLVVLAFGVPGDPAAALAPCSARCVWAGELP